MTGDVAANSPPNAGDGASENHHQQVEKPWISYISEDLPRTVQESADSALRSARSLQQNSSTQVRSLQVLYVFIIRLRFIAYVLNLYRIVLI